MTMNTRHITPLADSNNDYLTKGQRPVDVRTSWRLVSRGPGRTTRLSQSVLTVEDMETIDYGTYACKAKNQHGETIVTTDIIPR